MVRRVFGLNFLDAFIAGATTVAVPLLLSARGVDVASIGLIFAIVPIVKLVVKIAGAALGDAIGERAIYALNAVCNLGQVLSYSFASGAGGYALGKVFDSARDSFIFAVNRASVMARMPGREHFGLASMISGRFIYNALGSLSVGLLFAFGGFSLILAVLAAVAAFMVVVSLGVDNRHSPASRFSWSDLSPFGRKRVFYEGCAVLSLGSAVYIPVLYFLLPLYLSSSGFSLETIGLLYAGYFLLMGITMNVLSHKRAQSTATAIAGTAIFAIALLGMAFGGAGLLPYFFLLMPFGDACLAVIWEEVNYISVQGSRKRSTDLAVLATPAGIAIFAVSCVAGLIASQYGYAPMLVACALSLAAYSYLALRLRRIAN